MKPLLFDDGYCGRVERVVAVEYHPLNNRLFPVSVFTMSNDGSPRDGWISGLYDFAWCKRNGALYYDLSGSGGRFYIHPLCRPNDPPRCALWWERSLVWPTNGGNCSHRRLSDKTVRRFGYDILANPLGNPFDDACWGNTEYCVRCDDHLPADELCSHVWWCEKCGDFSKPGSRCTGEADETHP
jgi:hypothetical protein